MVTLLSVFSVACTLDSEKSSATGHNLPVLLLLSRRWSLAVAVLLPHLMKNSVPIHRKNIQATQVKCSRNDNCDKLESRKPISKQRKRQKAPEFAWISATLSFSCCTWYEVEPKKTRGNTTDLSVLNCCKTISCYFMLFCQRDPYLYRGLAFQVLQLLSMLFSSSSSRWGILCLPSKGSFEKFWNIVSRETSNWHELTFEYIWHHLTVFPIAWVWWINAQPTLLAGRQYGIASNKCAVAHLNFSKLVFELLHLTKKNTLCTILAYISNSPC